MTHLIDKDATVAEIKNLIDRCNIKKQSCPVNTQVEAICDNKIYAYKEILSLLDTLEVNGVDLEKEISEYFVSHSDEFFSDKYKLIAKHFFELGIKAARKGE